MAGLMDLINKNLQAPGALATPPPAGQQTQQASDLLRTKLTGKAGDVSSTPRQSSLGEALARQQTEGGLQDIANQGKIQGEQLQQSQQDVQQRSEQQTQEHQMKMSGIQQDFSNKANSILDNIAANHASMDTNQRLAQMEQAGFLIRHTNEQYVNELQRQGSLNRLNDKQQFQSALAQDIFQDQSDLFNDNTKFNTAMNADRRDFEKALAGMSTDFAIKMADNSLKQESKQAIVQGIGGLISGGVQAYGAANRPESKV